MLLSNLMYTLLGLGTTEGMTFRCMIEDGVGPIIEPNPQPTRMQPQAVEVKARPAIPGKSSKDYSRLHDRGYWKAKPVHFSEKFNKIRL